MPNTLSHQIQERFLNRRSRIFLKLENLQPSGSFKSRGIGNYMQHMLSRASDPNKVHFYSSSGGNAGLACVNAARFFGRPATVVVPNSTKPMMMTKIRAAGASEVLQHGAVWKEADAWLRDSAIPDAEKRGEVPIYTPPFDHPEVWNGNATLVKELEEQLEEGAPGVIICSVGGGGLFNGVVQGVELAGWRDTTILAMETQGADSLHKAIQQGEHITLPGISSQATSLGATRVSERSYELATTNNNVKCATLTDAEAAMGCWRFADDERIMVELACGVNVALCYGGRLEQALGRAVKPDEKVVIVLCGGSNVTVDMIAGWKQEFKHLHDEQSPSEKETVASAACVTNGSH